MDISINEIKTFLEPKFEKIINENSNILANVLRTRNKFIHEPHMIKWGYIVGGKTSCSICFIYKEEFIELNTIYISNVVNELNQIMFELQNKAFESVKNLDEETKSHPYLKNVMSFDFLEYDRERTRLFLFKEVPMIGTIIGDISGSRFEFRNHKGKKFEIFHKDCEFTDDSVMTLAIAKALIESKEDFEDLSEKTIFYMKEIGRPYRDCGYGGMFRRWIYSDATEPYGSYGNGAAMRVSACGFVGQTIEEVKMLTRKVTEVTHNHPEGLKGAEVTAVAIFLVKTGHTIPEVRAYIDENYYPMNFTLDEIRPTYAFKESCQETVPQAIMAFLESTSFEDAIRNAISIGSDSNTIGAITGGIAEAYYDVPKEMRAKAMEYLDERLREVVVEFDGICTK